MKCKNCKNLNRKIELSPVTYKYPWCYEINDSPDIEIERECEYCDTMTNADRIRNMSDGELSEWIHNIVKFQGEDMEPMVSIHDLDKEQDEVIHDSYGDLLEWLQKEVE